MGASSPRAKRSVSDERRLDLVELLGGLLGADSVLDVDFDELAHALLLDRKLLLATVGRQYVTRCDTVSTLARTPPPSRFPPAGPCGRTRACAPWRTAECSSAGRRCASCASVRRRPARSRAGARASPCRSGSPRGGSRGGSSTPAWCIRWCG